MAKELRLLFNVLDRNLEQLKRAYNNFTDPTVNSLHGFFHSLAATTARNFRYEYFNCNSLPIISS